MVDPSFSVRFHLEAFLQSQRVFPWIGFYDTLQLSLHKFKLLLVYSGCLGGFWLYPNLCLLSYISEEITCTLSVHFPFLIAFHTTWLVLSISNLFMSSIFSHSSWNINMSMWIIVPFWTVIMRGKMCLFICNFFHFIFWNFQVFCLIVATRVSSNHWGSLHQDHVPVQFL